MLLKDSISQLEPMSAVYAVNRALRKIDQRLVDHGERVAYIACKLQEYGALPMDVKTLFLLSIFHDVGAYKTDEIDRMVEFETHDVWDHAIYGYLFLKYLSPLKECAEAILYHHCSWEEIEKANIAYGDYAQLIHLADRIDIVSSYEEDSVEFFKLWNNESNLFNPAYLDVFHQCFQNGKFFEELTNETYQAVNLERCRAFQMQVDEVLDYLKMIVHAIDFRSEYTVTHTINTVSISIKIAEHFHLSQEETERIYLGALFHDVGKVAIPTEILEFPGKLTDEQMRVMRTHVYETEQLISGIIPDAICKIAIRHHEKLDGSGYPHGITGDKLSFAERIVAVADIVSALSSKRSYKQPFPKEKTLIILADMAKAQLDATICDYVQHNYDAIMESTENERKAIIAKYLMITHEYEVLRQKFLQPA